MRKLLILILFVLTTTFTFADTSGNGCKIGQDYVYTEYLGLGYPYVGQPGVRYYNSNGPKIPIYWGYGQNLHRGYRCGYINIYGASSYYDQETGQTVQIPAENEITNWYGQNCAIAPNLNAAPVATDSYVAYTYNRTNMCAGGPTTPVPIDDYVWLMVIGTALLGTFFLREKLFNL